MAVLIVLAIDRLTKFLVVKYLPFEVPVAPIPALSKWFSFTYIHNTGAAFGMFRQGCTLFALVAVCVVIGLIVWYDRLPVRHLLVRIAVGLIIGGAAGNLVDRVRTCYVVDFLDFHFWPVFNVADSAVVVGVVILGIYMLFSEGSAQGVEPQGKHLGREESGSV